MSDEIATAPDDLSLQEMLRVMDVARTLRKERETVAREFSRDETRAALRDRMLQATAVTGEELTEAEIDAALDAYYDNLHVFRPPPPGLATVFAQAWVLRRVIGVVLLLLVCAGLLVWWMASRPPASQAAAEQSPVTSATSNVAARPSPVTYERSNVAVPPAVVSDDAFEIRIVTGEGRRSGIDRYYTDEQGTRAPAFYVVVEAVTRDGQILPQRIRNAETGQFETVTSWGERVPDVVYERIKADKQADGVLDESLFAVKRQGESEMEIVLKGADGEPIPRGGQITKW